MGNLPEQYVAFYKESYNKAFNRLVREFSIKFCKKDEASPITVGKPA